MSETNLPDDTNEATTNTSVGQKRSRDHDDDGRNGQDGGGRNMNSTSSPSSTPDGHDETGGAGPRGTTVGADDETMPSSDSAPPAVAPATTKPPPSSLSSSSSSGQQGAVSAASAAVASQLCASMGLQGLYSLLSLTVMAGSTGSGGAVPGGAGASGDVAGTNGGGSSGSLGSNSLPTIEQVQQSALKFVSDNPPFCHLSKTDSAPQIKIVPDTHRLVCKGGMRGYRMTRGSHGVSEGNYYYEVVILDPPSASEIAQSLPSNVRLGGQLQRDMQDALRAEERTKAAASTSASDNALSKSAGDNKSDAGSSTGSFNNSSSSSRSKFGAHFRLGWSMRSGDLQAPVGYDRFSFAVRDIGGSKIHSSRRDDDWGGEDFGPGDVVGCSISLVPGGDRSAEKKSEEDMNHIRFFKNGYPMGEFFITKGRREGGIAFTIPDGMYYPAISLYMGASVQVNFGPNFVYPPRKLPAGMKLQPISNVCKTPISIEEATSKVTKEKVFRKSDMQQRFLDLVKAEVDVVQDAYQKQRRKHLQDVLAERKKRNLKTEDLENDEFYTDMNVE